MNKIIKTLAAFSLLAFAAACSKDVSSTPAGEEVTVTFSVTSPEFQTKAVSDGNTVDKVKCAAYDADGNLLAISAVETPVEMTSGKATWAVSLVSGQTYSFAFWAYSSKQSAYTFDATDAKVTVDYTKVTANDDTFDAFYAYKADFTVNGAFTETVTLTRPFAQLNLGASDLAKAKEAGFELATAAVSVKGVATSLNLKDGSVSGSADVAFEAATAPLANETLTVSGTEYDYVSMVYVLPGEALADVTYTLASAADKSIDVSVPNAPLKANYRTNVIGNIFTVGGAFDIVVDPDHGGDENVPTDSDAQLKELQYAFANGGEVTLYQDVEFPFIDLAAGKTVTVNLNGHTITAKGNSYGQGVRIRGNLVINGDGYWGDSKSIGYLFDLYDNGTLTVNGNGTFESALTCVQLSNNSKATINGGTWKGGAYNNCYWTINKIDKNKTTTSVEITAGTFVGFDPANAPTENPKENWVAEGYESVQYGNDYIVVPEGSTPVTTSVEAKSALADSEVSKVYLTAGTYELGTLAVTDKEIIGADGAVIDLSAESNSNPSDNGKSWKNVTLKNLTIKNNNSNYTGFRHSTGTLTFENCTFEGLMFGYGEHEVYKNCIFNQDTYEYSLWSYGATTADYIGCTFNSKGKALNIYNEKSDAANVYTVNVEDCKFVCDRDEAKEARTALWINSLGATFVVNVKNSTATGNFLNKNGGLWFVKNGAAKTVTVTVDGKTVWANGAAVE